MRSANIVGGDFIKNCIVIKLDDYDTEVSVINRNMGKINIIDNFEIEIDAGIGPENIADVSNAGVDIFVAGSAVYGAEDVSSRVAELIKLMGV